VYDSFDNYFILVLLILESHEWEKKRASNRYLRSLFLLWSWRNQDHIYRVFEALKNIWITKSSFSWQWSKLKFIFFVARVVEISCYRKKITFHAFVSLTIMIIKKYLLNKWNKILSICPHIYIRIWLGMAKVQGPIFYVCSL
jgi:hypothetical protein